MRGEQFDRLMTSMNAMRKSFDIFVEEFAKMRGRMDKLEDKTLVVSDIDKQIEQMKLDIESLKDEREED